MQSINVANVLTIARLILAPLFVVFYSFVDIWPGTLALPVALGIVWALFVIMEITDVLDGMIARRQDMVTDLGKVLDPFADVVCRLTYFVTLTYAGVMPLWFVFVVLYRELGSVFLRLLFFRAGYALGAGIPGKLKSWFYSIAGAVGLFLFSVDRLPNPPESILSALGAIRIIATVVFAVAAALALWSIGGYLLHYVRHRQESS